MSTVSTGFECVCRQKGKFMKSISFRLSSGCEQRLQAYASRYGLCRSEAMRRLLLNHPELGEEDADALVLHVCLSHREAVRLAPLLRQLARLAGKDRRDV